MGYAHLSQFCLAELQPEVHQRFHHHPNPSLYVKPMRFWCEHESVLKQVEERLYVRLEN